MLGVSAVALLAGCGGPGRHTADDPAKSVDVCAETGMRSAFDVLSADFRTTEAGAHVPLHGTFGPSATCAERLSQGKRADVLLSAAAPEVTHLVDIGAVDSSWDSGATHGVPCGSVVTFVVRPGNPKHLTTWQDLVRPDVRVLVPNPAHADLGKWDLLAAYLAMSAGGRDPTAGTDYLQTLLSTDHLPEHPDSARQAADLFQQGTGDVLLTSENAALSAERAGARQTHLTPQQTLRIDYPVAVTTGSRHPAQAVSFRDHLFTPSAQRAWSREGFRPVDPAVAAEFAPTFPAPAQLYTIADVGGWQTAESDLLSPGSGALTRWYEHPAH